MLHFYFFAIFVGYTLPATSAPTEEMGMEVNLGSSDDGSGDDQPFSTDNPAYQPEEMSKSQVDNNDAETPNDMTTDENDVECSCCKNKSETQQNPIQ